MGTSTRWALYAISVLLGVGASRILIRTSNDPGQARAIVVSTILVVCLLSVLIRSISKRSKAPKESSG